MTYSLTITRRAPNPDFDEQIKAAQERQQWRGPVNDLPWPQREHDVTALTVELSEAQWEAVKMAVLEVWK